MTFEAMLTVGMGGRIHTRPETDPDPEFAGGGKAAAAERDTQAAMDAPEPTVSATVGVEPSVSPAAGSGLCVEISAATGMAPRQMTATARAAGTRQREPANIHGR